MWQLQIIQTVNHFAGLPDVPDAIPRLLKLDAIALGRIVTPEQVRINNHQCACPTCRNRGKIIPKHAAARSFQDAFGSFCVVSRPST